VHALDEAERAADRLAAALGGVACTREALESIPVADLLAATEEIAKRPPDPGLIPLPFLPVVDGVFLPQHPLEAVGRGSAAGVDLLIGTNRDELALFGLGRPELSVLDDASLVRWVDNAAPDVPSSALIQHYRSIREGRSEAVDPRSVMIALGSDGVFRWPSLQLAAAQAAPGTGTYVYLFEWESPAFGGVLGSCHALELPFVFGVVDVPAVQMFTGAGIEVEQLSQQMQQAWLAFASTGNPTRAELDWPPWNADLRSTMVFGERTGAVEGPRNQELSAWEQHRPLRATPAA